MKEEKIKIDCPVGKSVIEEMAYQLCKRMVTNKQVKAMAELEFDIPSVTISMIIEIKRKLK